MLELHGWLTIQETFGDEDLLSPEKAEAIRQRVKEIVESNTSGIRMQYANGTAFLNTLFCANHRTAEVDEIIETYQSIAKAATGSYGVIYLRDDEDEQYHNAFQMYIFKRGQCIFKADTNLSPCIPTIEDDVSWHKPHRM